jgi:CcmD family protein
MENSVFLFAAFSITWSVIFIYVFKLFKGQRDLNAQIAAIKKKLQLEIELDDGKP